VNAASSLLKLGLVNGVENILKDTRWIFFHIHTVHLDIIKALFIHQLMH